MTEASSETVTMTEVLFRHGFYSHDGVIRIAIDGNTLQDLMGSETYTVSPRDVTLIDRPGGHEWTTRMSRIYTHMSHEYETTRKMLDERNSYIEKLGEALLEKADEHNWCEEYDEFAEEWDLPSRSKEFDVTITVRVEARNEEGAAEIARDNVAFDSYSTGVVSGPDINVDEVY